jgi:rubrerythrin
MASFLNPFVGMLPARKMNRDELIRSMRLDLSAEQEAIHLYTAQAESTDNPVARQRLLEIADDERVHVGNFLRLIEMFTGDEGKFLLKGAAEADEGTAAIRSPEWVSPEFNPLDPLGLMKGIVNDVQRLATPVKKLALGAMGEK